LFDPVWCSRPTRFSPCLFVTSTLCSVAAVQKPNHMDSIRHSEAGYVLLHPPSLRRSITDNKNSEQAVVKQDQGREALTGIGRVLGWAERLCHGYPPGRSPVGNRDRYGAGRCSRRRRPKQSAGVAGVRTEEIPGACLISCPQPAWLAGLALFSFSLALMLQLLYLIVMFLMSQADLRLCLIWAANETDHLASRKG
jgi:hypothetical protein